MVADKTRGFRQFLLAGLLLITVAIALFYYSSTRKRDFSTELSLALKNLDVTAFQRIVADAKEAGQECTLYPIVLEGLRADEVEKRQISGTALHFIASADLVPALIDGFQDPAPEVRYQCVRAVAKTNPHGSRAVPLLVTILKKQDEERRVRCEAAMSLATLDDGSMNCLLSLLDVLSPDVAAMPRLVQVMNEGDYAQHELALRGFFYIGHEAQPASAVVEQCLSHHEDQHTRIMAAYTLTRIGAVSDAVLEVLIDGLNADSELERRRNKTHTFRWQ